MLHAVAARFLEFVSLTAECVPIEMLYDQKDSFIASLRAGPYKTSSVKSYRNYLNILLRRAHEAGWVRTEKVLPSDWQAVIDVLPSHHMRSIVSFAVRIGKDPGTLCEDDLAAWRLERVKEGRSLKDAEGDCSRFRTAIVRTGLSAQLPLIKPRVNRYGVALADMHPDLRREIEELMEWKQSEFQLDRATTRIRPISAKKLTNLICRIAGYVQKITREPEITSLSDLISRDHIAGFTTWAINTRKMMGRSLVSELGMIFAALRHNPRYKALDLSWFKSIIDQLPFESQSTIDQRKAKKYISYAEAEEIPLRIRAQRKKTKAPSPRTLAIYARNELLMQWLFLLAWRQRNIRDCRVSGDAPNLFKAPIGPFCRATKPLWVVK
jgi:hypothetical protein